MYGILEDENDYLWISTNQGLARFNTETEQFLSFDTSDGLQANEFNTGAWYKSADGDLFFGGINGFNRFRPERIHLNQHVPPIALTAFSIFNRPVEQRGLSSSYLRYLTLQHDENFFSFEFSALDFVNPLQNRYAYMLEGLDKQWVMSGNRRYAGYTNVHPGSYVFRVKGSNSDGVWNSEGLSLALDIHPPFWQKLWFRVTVFLTLVFLILFFHRFRLASLKRQKQLLSLQVAERTSELESINRELSRSHEQITETNTLLRQEIEAREATEQELLRARDSAESASRLKSSFLAAMSHEIRTPMNGVIGMATLLADTSLNERQTEYLEIIRTSGESLLAILNDILDFSKIEAGKLELDPHPFELCHCVEEVLCLLAHKFEEKGLAYGYVAAPEVPPFISADSVRLKQILFNLVGNALKFTGRGSVRVSLSRVQNDRDDRAITLRFSVEDTGIGIPPEKQALLFRSFSQVDTTTTRKFGGTGLGLAITRSLVAMMGGEIEVVSEEGEGAIFSFSIIVEAAPVEERPYLAPVDPRLEGCKVLVASNDALLVDFIHAECRNWGVDCLVLEQPVSTDSLERLGTALIILDAKDPRSSEIRDEVEKCYPNFPHVMVSTSVQEDGGGPQRILSRPLRRAALYRALVGLLLSETVEMKDEATPVFDRNFAKKYPRRILAAEDNRVNRLLIKKVLGRLGYEIDLAENGLIALEMAVNNHYDLILMDLQMPEMDGLEATCQIRQRFEEMPTQERPLVWALTASALEVERERCLKAGLDGFLCKPIRVEEICRVLRLMGSEIKG